MRDFLINALESIIGAMIVLGAFVVIIAGIGTMFAPDGGFFRGIGVLIGGSLWLLMTGGMAYLGLGVYHNTRRTAEAVEELLRRG